MKLRSDYAVSCKIIFVIPDLIRYPEFTFKRVNLGCRIKVRHDAKTLNSSSASKLILDLST